MKFQGVGFNGPWVASFELKSFIAEMSNDCYNHIFSDVGKKKRVDLFKELHQLARLQYRSDSPPTDQQGGE
jgi:hypothetical protein